MKAFLLPLGITLLFVFGLVLGAGSMETSGTLGLLGWIALSLLLILLVLTIYHGWRLLRERREQRPGSQLRSKLVLALVAMLIVPSLILQLTANQMVEGALNVWFDLRVDKLLNQALGLTQSVYGRLESDMENNLGLVRQDSALLAGMSSSPVAIDTLKPLLKNYRQRFGWSNITILDTNGRILLGDSEDALHQSVQETSVPDEDFRQAQTMRRVVTFSDDKNGNESILGLIVIDNDLQLLGFVQARIILPVGFVESARAIEADYSLYRELERNREDIASLFRRMMLIVTLMVVLLTGWIAILFSRRITAPVGGLTHAFERVTEGDFDVSVPTRSKDELNTLVNIFNRMVVRLKENRDALELAHKEQEQALRKVKDRQNFLETLIANLKTGVLQVESKGRIVLFNQALKDILALPAGWKPGKSIDAFSSSRLAPLLEFMHMLQAQDVPYLQKEVQVPVGGKNITLLVRGATLLSRHRHQGFVLVVDDITALADAQKSRAWADIARRMAHEIKNPLTPIKLSTERLQRKIRPQVNDVEIFDRCTSAIIVQVERLQRLINDFSLLARLPEPRMSNVNLHTVCEELKDLYAAYSNVEIQMPEMACVCAGDPDQIRQVALNLLDNAVAAARLHKQLIRFYITVENGMLQIHVVDEGEGISKDDAQQIFEPYFSTKEDGSGLGLSIAHKIASEHGGELRLISSRRPTHFCFSIPFRTLEKAA